MKKTNAFYLILLILLMSFPTRTFGQSVPEEARRHFDRGMAALEMAKSPDDYAPAIKEFEQAIRLAPSWPDVYYNLGMVQEKAGKYSDAVTSLKQYLRLAPNASDTETVKSLINKLEYKAEIVLTVADITSVLSSFLRWKMTGDCWMGGSQGWDFGIQRVGYDSLKLVTAHYAGPNGVYWQTLKVDGPIFRFTYTYSMCGRDVSGYSAPDGSPCSATSENKIEVLSRDKVKMTQRVNGCGFDVKGFSRCTDPARHHSCVFVKGADIK